jgi:hypothetical protein
MRKHSEKGSKEFMSSGQDGFFIGQSVSPSFKEVRLKSVIESNNTCGHKINNSSEVAVTSFRYSTCALKLTRLIDRGVDTCIGNKAFMGGEVFNTTDFSKESGTCSGINTINGGNNFEFINGDALALLFKGSVEGIESFQKVQEGGDFLTEDEFFSRAYGGDRVFSGMDELFRRHRGSSASTIKTEGLREGLGIRGGDDACRGELLKELEHGFSEGITEAEEFGEGSLKEPFDFVFGRGDKGCDGFSFSGNISEVREVLGDMGLGDGVFMDEDKTGNGEGVFFVGFGFSEGEFSEVKDQEGVDNDGIKAFLGEEGEEIDVVTTSGFHGNECRGRTAAVGGDVFKEGGEALFVHTGREREKGFAFCVNTSSREGILGDIDTDEESIHFGTSLRYSADKAGEASRPILHSDEGSLTQSTYDGYGRQGTNSLKGSKTQVKWSSPAFPPLIYTGKTCLLYNNQ